jgi:threonine dehydrogenase-like Zn-dependent dehydrogenase
MWIMRVTSLHEGTMRAAVLVGPRTINVTRTSIPQVGKGQVRVRIEGCGVCASNVEPWDGAEWMEYPTNAGALGHEAWGVVDAVGDDVEKIVVGDRVATLFTNSFAEYDVGDACAVVKLPPSLDEKAFPGEPLGCVMNIFRRCHVERGSWVAIVGIGFLGALLTRLASQAGARVIALSRRQNSLDLAREMGAAYTVLMDAHRAIIEQVRTITAGAMCQRAIEATGHQWPLDIAAEVVRAGGRLIIAGYHQDGPRYVNMQQWNWKGLDVVNAHEREPAIYRRGVEEAIEACATGLLTPERLYTNMYSLEDLGLALKTTRDRPDGFVKALVMMRRC